MFSIVLVFVNIFTRMMVVTAHIFLIISTTTSCNYCANYRWQRVPSIRSTSF